MPMHREWVDLAMASLNVPTNSAIVPLDILNDMRVEPNKTVVRLIIGLTFHHEQTSTNEDARLRLTAGIGVATQEGFDVGASGVPSPAVTTEFPIHGWLWRAQWACLFSNSATLPV